MATLPDEPSLNIREQIARINKTQEELSKLSAETRKFVFESLKLDVETRHMPRSMIFQAMLATAALLGAGAAIAKLLF